MSRTDHTSEMTERLNQMTIGGARRINSTIELREYDPRWLEHFAWHRDLIRRALGDRALVVEHVGSTSVPGLAAKPKIDILLVVADSSREEDYLPALEVVGYELRIREPEWYEHRVVVRSDREVNVHIFSPGCVEVDRMLRFRDWLRTHPDDVNLYLSRKRELAARRWVYVQMYADAKSEVVEEIIARAMAPTGK